MSECIEKIKVLICDDDDLLREFYSRVLTTQGYETVSACNGDEAIDALESGNGEFGLAIIDLLMPIRTGWELIEYMKEKNMLKNIPIIAITGLASSIDELDKVGETCDHVLHKGDFDLEEFTSIITDLISE